ncbi:hypothetical protein [Vagococcus fluvialis]|nr:hypothetical protein [Vagococcus fluvialis]
MIVPIPDIHLNRLPANDFPNPEIRVAFHSPFTTPWEIVKPFLL